MSCHDSNYAYFDGEKVRYHKLERAAQFKHYTHNNPWQWKYSVEHVFDIDINEIDEIVFDFALYNPTSITLAEYEHNLQSSGSARFPNTDQVYNNYYYDRFSENTRRLFREKQTGKQLYFKATDDLLSMWQHDKDNAWMISHYYAHSLSGWMLTEKTPDVSIVIDGAGDFERSSSVFRGDTLIDYGLMKNSIGIKIYELAEWSGVKFENPLDSAGKLMGLQSFGKIDKDFLNFLQRFDYSTINEMFDKTLWGKYKGDNLVGNLDAINYAATIHKRTGEILVETFKKYAKPDETVFYSGGVAQNVVWNSELKRHFPNLIIAPHSSDEGLSLGGLEFLRKKNNLPPFQTKEFPYWQEDVQPKTQVSDSNIQLAARLLAEGKIIGWYQGKGEVGPRALGNRSILMDPRIANGKDIINLVKNRENYRPFGASVLKEYQQEYFDIAWDDDYMLYTTNVKVNTLPAVTHVDGTCRIHTVADKNPVFRKLLQEFYNITGCPVILNTSMNLAGKPLAAYPEVAKELFDRTLLDAVFIGDKVYRKLNSV